jgi:hypothetical protein
MPIERKRDIKQREISVPLVAEIDFRWRRVGGSEHLYDLTIAIKLREDDSSFSSFNSTVYYDANKGAFSMAFSDGPWEGIPTLVQIIKAEDPNKKDLRHNIVLKMADQFQPDFEAFIESLNLDFSRGNINDIIGYDESLLKS